MSDNKAAFIIFTHSTVQTLLDVEDMIDNIRHFHNNCEFFINHPTIDHPNIKARHLLGDLNRSNFIFGAFIEILNKLTIEEINNFDHFCLVSANQYFISKIEFEKDVNYLQFLNTENWEATYKGKDTSTEVIGFPLQQPYGRWDMKDLYKKYNLDNPMSANWECATLTKESMLLAKQHISSCLEIYPNEDMINIFPAYMALLSKQEWKYPAHFGTYDPSNPQPKNWILTLNQLLDKKHCGYYSIKRVNYTKDCPIKEYVRNNYYHD